MGLSWMFMVISNILCGLVDDTFLDSLVDDTWNSRVIKNLNSLSSRLQQPFSTELEGQSRAGKSQIIIWKMAMNFNVYAVQFGYWSPLSAGSVSVYLQISWIFFYMHLA